MRFSAIAVLAALAVAAGACSPGQNTAAPTSTAALEESPILPTPTETQVLPTDTPSGPLGSISGKIRPVAPNSGEPGSMRVGARETITGRVVLVDIPEGQTTYVIPGLPVGVYIVFGWIYPNGVMGAYTSTDVETVMTSSEQMTCNNSVLTIALEPGKMDFTGADIGCWAGDYYLYLTPMP